MQAKDALCGTVKFGGSGMGIRERLRGMLRRPPSQPSENRWLLDLTTLRDGQIYQQHFGRPHRMSIEPSPMSRLSAVVPSVDPRWEHTGVYAYPPARERTAWLMVTAGLSNPWHQPLPPALPDDPSRVRSGAGIELCLLTPQRTEWAADVLSALMARQQCIAAGSLPGERLQVGDVVSLATLTLPRGPQPPPDLESFLVTGPVGFPLGFQLPYGSVEWLLLVGLTAAQAAAQPLVMPAGGITLA